MKGTGFRTFLRFGIAGLAIAALTLVGFAQGALAQDTEIIIPIEELNSSGVSGDATLTDNGDGTTTIDVLVDGASGDHPIHLHSGTCAELGDIVVPLTDVDSSGSSVTDVDIPLATIQDPEVGPHAINIHLSAEEISTYVACGDIPLSDESAAAGGEEDAMADDEMAGDDMADEGTGGETETTTTPAAGVGPSLDGNNSLLAGLAFVAAVLGFAGIALRRGDVRI